MSKYRHYIIDIFGLYPIFFIYAALQHFFLTFIYSPPICALQQTNGITDG